MFFFHYHYCTWRRLLQLRGICDRRDLRRLGRGCEPSIEFGFLNSRLFEKKAIVCVLTRDGAPGCLERKWIGSTHNFYIDLSPLK